MNFIQFTEFRNHSKQYFDKVEHGDSYVIIRKGKPVAKIVPFSEKTAGWKRETRRIRLKSSRTSLDIIMRERSEK